MAARILRFADRREDMHPGPDILMIAPAFLSCYLSVLTFLFGACVGSFLNVCIYRIPLEMSVVTPRSHCFRCDHPVAWYDNIPLVSYVLLRGRCRQCRAPYSPRYVLVELLTAVLFLLVWIEYGGGPGAPVLDPRIPVYWIVVSGLILGTFVDFDHLILPDRVTIGGMIAGVVCSLLVPSLHGVDTVTAAWIQSTLGIAQPLHGFDAVIVAGIQSLFGLAVGFGSLWLVGRIGTVIFRQDAMGFGDVKLLGAVGAFFGWQGVLFTVLLSSFAGSLVGVTLILVRGREARSPIPYGPYLALGALVWMLWGDEWWKMYLTLFPELGA